MTRRRRLVLLEDQKDVILLDVSAPPPAMAPQALKEEKERDEPKEAERG